MEPPPPGNTLLLAAATSLLPSDDEATEVNIPGTLALVGVHITPEFVEM
jgi:hypothetical protein